MVPVSLDLEGMTPALTTCGTRVPHQYLIDRTEARLLVLEDDGRAARSVYEVPATSVRRITYCAPR